MLIRRVSAHVRAQNWTAVALDFLIVVIGIFVGLQVSNWNDSRVLREKESLLLARLASDFESIDSRLHKHIDEYYQTMLAIEYVIDALEGQAESDSVKFRKQLDRVTWVVAPPGRSATFMEMLSAGKVDLVHDEDLRSLLVVFDQKVESVNSAFVLLQNTRLAYSEAFLSKVKFVIDTPNSSLETSGAIQSFDLDAMRADDRLFTFLQIQYQINDNMYHLLKQLLVSAQNVRENLSGQGY